MLIICGYYFVIRSYPHKETPVNQAKLDVLLAQMELNKNNSSYPDKFKSSNYTPDQKNNKGKVLQSFDPNNDNFESLLRKGVPYKAAKNIANFAQKGGVFRSKSDVKKMYSISEEMYADLEPYIVISTNAQSGKTLPATSPFNNTGQKEKKLSISINTATQSDLEQLKGIGPSYAARIIKYRGYYGGFYSPDQLFLIKGMDSSLINSILPNLVFDTKAIIGLHINSSSADELAKHPYLSYKEAEAIINYRNQHGLFKNTADILELHIFKTKDVNRLIPYLDLN